MTGPDDPGEDSASAADGDDPTPSDAGADRDVPVEDQDTENWDVSLEDLEADAPPEHIEPGSPSPEHVAFVVLGVVLTVAVIYRLVSLVGATVG